MHQHTYTTPTHLCHTHTPTHTHTYTHPHTTCTHSPHITPHTSHTHTHSHPTCHKHTHTYSHPTHHTHTPHTLTPHTSHTHTLTCHTQPTCHIHIHTPTQHTHSDTPQTPPPTPPYSQNTRVYGREETFMLNACHSPSNTSRNQGWHSALTVWCIHSEGLRVMTSSQILSPSIDFSQRGLCMMSSHDNLHHVIHVTHFCLRVSWRYLRATHYNENVQSLRIHRFTIRSGLIHTGRATRCKANGTCVHEWKCPHTLHTSNIKGFAREFGRAHPVHTCVDEASGIEIKKSWKTKQNERHREKISKKKA